jgi:hypothetical protein
MLQNSNDEAGNITLEIDTFYGIRISVLLEEWKEPFADVFDVLRFDVFKDINMDEIPDKVREKPVVIEDKFETVIDYVMNGHKFSMPYYCTGMHDALNFEKNYETI